MNTLLFAWRCLVRQPARASLGLLGVAAIGALLFDMLMLSSGLVTSMRDLFDRAGFDVRVATTEERPGLGPLLPEADAVVDAVAATSGVRSAFALRMADAVVESGPRRVRVSWQGVSGRGARPWTVIEGRDIAAGAEALVNENTARRLGVAPGASIVARPSCRDDQSLPPVTLFVAGIATFPFDAAHTATVATTLEFAAAACGDASDRSADIIIVATADDQPRATVAAGIAKAVPHLTVMTNDDMVQRLERGGFSYFRQISSVLTTVTLAFAVLLISVLLTVSVNQRLGEIAALRALGFTRWRVVADVLAESALLVGGGGLLSLPLGWALAQGLDAILKGMPGLPVAVHFFVFRPSALAVHSGLLAATAIAAALYPMYLVARLPIAATLRDEVIG
ncbi:MAG: ABC transporter permease [Acidobacteriota bacterium]